MHCSNPRNGGRSVLPLRSLLQRGAVDWGKPMCHRQLSATVRLGARSILSLAPRNLGVADGHVACRGRDHVSKRGARRPAWPGISTFVAECHASDLTIYNECRWRICVACSQLARDAFDEARLASSLNSALRPRESGFTKIGKSWVPVFVNEDHAKTAIFEQNRIRNYPNRAYPIPDGLEQSLLLGLQDDLEHCSVIVDKHSSTCVPRNTQAVRFDPNSLRTTSPFWRGRTEGSSEEVELVLPLND